ncbi:hypothetical protein GW17_00004993 [Ensete ventricosum]|nr:hypothetical protein GW17_00004993 [Ensete ventricosum]
MGSKPWLIPVPNYRRLDSSWETDDDEDAPGPRCAHSLTAVDATKSRGARLILFGGATAIEGGASSAVPGISNSPPPLFPPLALPALRWCFRLMVVPVFFGAKGSRESRIRFTRMTLIPENGPGVDFSLSSSMISGYELILLMRMQQSSFPTGRIHPVGEPPSPRAAHAAASVGTMVVFQGVKQVVSVLYAVVICCRVVVQGPGPGPRYGHTMDLVAQRYLVTVSGNDGEFVSSNFNIMLNQLNLCGT